ncbi:MAG: sigma-70 family RNA polymerase sigma factor [Clostridia bacterium]|nr:sigma-70 family RNA polymerase sigma factor [Clostridia bacterium]MDE7256520.1 sigma-70 family RNA polymerase sigma factor [Clostridia bacterium]
MKGLEKKHDNKQFNTLIKRMSLGDKDAFEEFYDYYGKFIFAQAWSVTNSISLADEITNEVLIRVWTASQKGFEIRSPIGWIYTITLNCARAKIKQEKQFTEIYDFPCDDANIELVDSTDVFYKTIAPLKEKEKQIIIFRMIEDLPFKAISKIMEIPVASVSAVFYRALNKIKIKEF